MHDAGQLHQAPFEAIRRERPDGEDYWSARELAGLLEYETHYSFFPALSIARQECASAGRIVEQHFLRVDEVEKSGAGRKRNRPDMQLSRLGCYLVVQNADPAKPQVALCLLVITPGKEMSGAEGIVVKYKLSDRKPGPDVKLQLAAYGLLVETLWNIPVQRGFLYQLPLRWAEPIALTTRLKNQVRETVAAIRAMIEREALPPPPARQAICVICEFRRFCNDVL